MNRRPTLPVGGRRARALAGYITVAVLVALALGSVYRLDEPATPTSDAEPLATLQNALLLATVAEREHAQALREAQQACRAARGADAVMFTTPEGHLVCRHRAPAL